MSKFCSVFDLTNKYGPVMAEAKELLRQTLEFTESWDSSDMTLEMRKITGYKKK